MPAAIPTDTVLAAPGFLTGPIDLAGTLVSNLSDLLHPTFGTASVAAAIVLFTMSIRALLSPLGYIQARAQLGRERLGPRIALINHRHAKDPARQQRELAEMYRSEGVSPLAGCLPALAQAPFLFLLFSLFRGSGDILSHALAGMPLSAHPFAELGGSAAAADAAAAAVAALVLAVALTAACLHVRNAKATTRRAQALSAASAASAAAEAGKSSGKGANKGSGKNKATSKSNSNANSQANSNKANSKAGSNKASSNKASSNKADSKAPTATKPAPVPTAAAPAPAPAALPPAFTRALPYLPLTLVMSVGAVPLAAGLYLVTSSLWTAAERPLMRALAARRSRDVAATA
ncbi:YidC/Oxa1 family membrane protein insertase [Yinghuangia soli]|uniref:Membrane protein insertase YidC n=1 Tax=Yinghuangia soli TaxID=2908204 RepID=A0AA41U6H6_9ACTN|nr:membrane protein insertase YidC [Yinghuangia soli]MCF2532997.1 membrane protein insertase YidC [Yinghuangia soli]